MFPALTQSFLQSLPVSPEQNRRIERGFAELPQMEITPCTGSLAGRAVQIETASGGCYLVFSEICSCPDFCERIGPGRIAATACKHMVAVHAIGALPEPGSRLTHIRSIIDADALLLAA